MHEASGQASKWCVHARCVVIRPPRDCCGPAVRLSWNKNLNRQTKRLAAAVVWPTMQASAARVVLRHARHVVQPAARRPSSAAGGAAIHTCAHVQTRLPLWAAMSGPLQRGPYEAFAARCGPHSSFGTTSSSGHRSAADPSAADTAADESAAGHSKQEQKKYGAADSDSAPRSWHARVKRQLSVLR